MCSISRFSKYFRKISAIKPDIGEPTAMRENEHRGKLLHSILSPVQHDY
jgi:hypothetical protein